ncbi:MAG: prolipoprotein diacylglyceryl transferase [Myxococcales bacterium]|nr:MAG: prolipoprotein diacylglyceryl transferase [Myxococcales bacterium]
MQPILFVIPGLDLPVYGYGLMLGLAFLVGWYAALTSARWLRLDVDALYPAMAAAIVASIVGARLLYILTNLDEHWTFARMLNIRQGGLVAYGGYIAGVAAGVYVFMRKRVNAWAYVDAVTPLLAVGLGLTRIGCFLRGCCFGRVSDSPLAISFPPESLVHDEHVKQGIPLLTDGWTTPVLPTQLFESMVGFSIAAIALAWLAFIRPRNLASQEALERGETDAPPRRDGYAFVLFLALYAVWRFCVEFLRDDQARGWIGPLSTSQFISLWMLALAIFLGAYWLPRHPWRRKSVEIDRATRRRQTRAGRRKR